MKELKINGVEEITTMVGTRKEIYNKIAELNPLAIIDYRQAGVKIENEWYLIILKRVDKLYKVRIIWRTQDNTQFEF